jgi:hypothetical protein
VSWWVAQPLPLNFRVAAPSRFSKGLDLDCPILESSKIKGPAIRTYHEGAGVTYFEAATARSSVRRMKR